MRYTFIPRIDSNDKENDIDRKWPVDSAETDTPGDLTKQVSGRSSLTNDYLNNALQNLVDGLPLFLLIKILILPNPPDDTLSSSDG